MVFYSTMNLSVVENFVTRKITLAAGRIAEGLQDHLELGNMDSLRDWGYAKDYVECMWMILQHDTPEDFVIATGEQHTVRDFTEKAFAANGITIRWEGEGINEKGYDAETGKMLVCVNPQWFRPTDVDNLWGDPTKAKTVLGWNPQKTSYEELVEIMAKHDRALAKKEAAMKNAMGRISGTIPYCPKAAEYLNQGTLLTKGVDDRTYNTTIKSLAEIIMKEE